MIHTHYLCALLAAAALAGSGVAAAEGPLPGPVPAAVERVIDGDTVKVRATIWVGQEVDVAVRLAGVDAPELFHPKCAAEKARALKARSFVEGFFAGGEARLYDVHYGKYAGRVVARVENGAGKDLSSDLLAAGLAAPYSARRGWCSE